MAQRLARGGGGRGATAANMLRLVVSNSGRRVGDPGHRRILPARQPRCLSRAPSALGFAAGAMRDPEHGVDGCVARLAATHDEVVLVKIQIYGEGSVEPFQADAWVNQAAACLVAEPILGDMHGLHLDVSGELV